MSEREKKWRRYRFFTKLVEDYRPCIFNPRYPWWCSAESIDYVVIVAYLPIDEPLTKYWNDAFEVTHTEEETITFSSRFPQPSYYVRE